MQAETEIDGGGKRTLLVIVLKAGAVVKIVAKGGLEVESELWRERIFGTYGGPNGELPGPYTIDRLFFRPPVLDGHTWVIDGFAVNERKRRRQVFIKKDKKTGQQVLLSDQIYNEKSKTLHNNWGWDGYFNGWFLEGCFDSRNASKCSSTFTRADDSSRNYQYNRKIYINLRHQ